MSKEIRRFILIFLLIFAVFTCAVVISESINYKHIVNTYPSRLQVAVPDTVKVAIPSQEAFDFQKSKVTTWLIRTFLSFVVPAFYIFSRLSVKIRNWAARRAKRWITLIILYFLTYSIIEMLIYLPLDIYTGFMRMHQYGLSNQTFSQWFADMLKSFVVNSAISTFVVAVIFYIIRKAPKRWWIYLALISVPYLFFMSYIQPIVIDPIYNEYRKIDNSELSYRIDNLLSQTKIGDCQVLVVDKSKETNQMNAYMTGVFNTKRIVLWDTTINNLTIDEVLGVVAHEMGHYLMGHIWKSILLGGLGAILLLYLVYRMSNWALIRLKEKLGFSELYDVAAFPLLVFIVNIVLFALTPISNAYSRGIELEADRFELELTKNNYATATATVKLHERSLTMPEPGIIYLLWNYDHPTYKSRIDFANEYKPWEYGDSLKYKKFIEENDQTK